MLGQVHDEEWFRSFGARQSGKTTALKCLKRALIESGKYICLYMPLQSLNEESTWEDTGKRGFAAEMMKIVANAIEYEQG